MANVKQVVLPAAEQLRAALVPTDPQVMLDSVKTRILYQAGRGLPSADITRYMPEVDLDALLKGATTPALTVLKEALRDGGYKLSWCGINRTASVWWGYSHDPRTAGAAR